MTLRQQIDEIVRAQSINGRDPQSEDRMIERIMSVIEPKRTAEEVIDELISVAVMSDKWSIDESRARAREEVKSLKQELLDLINNK